MKHTAKHTPLSESLRALRKAFEDGAENAVLETRIGDVLRLAPWETGQGVPPGLLAAPWRDVERWTPRMLVYFLRACVRHGTTVRQEIRKRLAALVGAEPGK